MIPSSVSDKTFFMGDSIARRGRARQTATLTRGFIPLRPTGNVAVQRGTARRAEGLLQAVTWDYPGKL